MRSPLTGLGAEGMEAMGSSFAYNRRTELCMHDASGKLTSRLSITFITLFVRYFCFSILFLDRAIGCKIGRLLQR